MDSDDFLNDDPGSLSDSVPASNVNPGISPHNEPALHEDLHVNMDFPILPSESIHCINCGTEITHRRRHIVNLVEVQQVILQWIAPQVTGENSFVCHPCWIIALNASISVQGSSSDASASSDPGRHRQLCVNCRCSLLRIRSHGISNDTERERHIRSVILQWIYPRELTASDRICHPCWQRADRHSTRNVGRDAIDDVQQGDNAEIQQGSDSGVQDWESGFIEMPKDLYQAHLRPGVIFRIHMSEAVLKMQYRNYGEDKDESVIEADVEYLRLTRKVINDEITKFEDLQWLNGWFHNRSDLIQEHMCNTRYYTVGTPPTMFTHSEEYMKRMCLFDSVYIDHIPYVVGEDSSLMASVAPPVLHCDAATCTSVPFIDSVMFDERLSRTNVRTLTRCQASCRAHCRNDPDCLKRCSDRCLRSD